MWTLNDDESLLDNLGRQGRPSRICRRASRCYVSVSLLDPEEWKDPFKGWMSRSSTEDSQASPVPSGKPVPQLAPRATAGVEVVEAETVVVHVQMPLSSNCHSGSEGSPTTQ